MSSGLFDTRYAMETSLCSFCRHPNPPAAKFCNACGSSLQLQLCPHCGAIDNIGALTCYKCGQPHGADDDTATAAGNETLTPQAATGDDRREAPAVRRSGRWAVAVALLLAVTGAVLFQRMWRGGGDDLPASDAPTAAATAQGVVAAVGASPPAPPIRPQEEASTAPGTEPIDVSAVPPPEEVGAPPPTACSPAVAALGLCDHQGK
jgi:ribosomal protein L40E